MAWWPRRRSRWAGVDFLALQPERNVAFRLNADDGLVVLLAPRFRSGLLARWLQPRLRPERAHFRVKLEARGSWIWNRCDGQRLVGQIASDFRDAFPAETSDVEKRVCLFLFSLAENGLVVFRNLEQVRASAPTETSPG